jgi:uncharacterized protein (TIGR00245 family)
MRLLALMVGCQLFGGWQLWSVSPAWAVETTVQLASSGCGPIASTLPIPLGVSHVARAATLLLTSTVLGLWGWTKVPRTARAVGMAWLRSATQLYWMGGVLLAELLTAGSTRPWLVLGWISLTAAVAAQEALTRVEYTYPALSRHMLYAVSGGAGVTLAATLLGRLLGPVDPWFAPRTWIPLSGMVLGNALTGTALAAKTVTQELAINRDQIELRLTQGATWQEAVQPVLQTVYTTSLTPIMNFLSAAGIVHIPGLMTGQILAGQAPIQAATYQVVVFALMATCVCLSVQFLTHLAVSNLVDQSNDRLRLASLQPVDKRKRKKRDYLPSTLRIVPEFCSAMKRKVLREIERRQAILDHVMHRKEDGIERRIDAAATPRTQSDAEPGVYSVELMRPVNDTNAEKSPILSVTNMRVARTHMDVSLDVRYDDRIALTGRSGIGKSQVLKTLAGLEPVNRQALALLEIPATTMSMAEWRSHVLLVPQERPSLEGTPHQFYAQVNAFASQQSQRQNVIAGHCQTPAEYSAEWGLNATCLDQPWSTLSGGESQRALLAIALALQPDVLLLDESTSALDDGTARRVEATLKRLRIPVVMVSHSAAQVGRFCNLELNLERDGDARRRVPASVYQ